MKICYWFDVARSISREGEVIRRTHPEIPFVKCYKCSGFELETNCPYYEGREVFSLGEEQLKDLEERMSHFY